MIWVSFYHYLRSSWQLTQFSHKTLYHVLLGCHSTVILSGQLLIVVTWHIWHMTSAMLVLWHWAHKPGMYMVDSLQTWNVYGSQLWRLVLVSSSNSHRQGTMEYCGVGLSTPKTLSQHNIAKGQKLPCLKTLIYTNSALIGVCKDFAYIWGNLLIVDKNSILLRLCYQKRQYYHEYAPQELCISFRPSLHSFINVWKKWHICIIFENQWYFRMMALPAQEHYSAFGYLGTCSSPGLTCKMQCTCATTIPWDIHQTRCHFICLTVFTTKQWSFNIW